MQDPEEIMARLEQEQCWYPFVTCNMKAEKKTKEPIGSDPMQYCMKHDGAMRKHYALNGK